MGWAKHEMMRRQDQGWCSVGNKQVCARCISDDAIKLFIKANASARRCSYCKRTHSRPIAAEMDIVLEFVADGINSEYEDPANGVGYESAEGGYLLPTTDSSDLLSDLDLGDSNMDLFDDLCRAFSQHEWVHDDPYGDRLCDALRYSWTAFSTQVKHHSRFVFFRLTTPAKEEWEEEPYGILQSLHDIVIKLGLVTTIPPGTSFFRIRRHGQRERFTKAKDLGTPPAAFASHSRMSPAGIPMLYVAKEAATAEAETPPDDPSKDRLTLARFINVRPLRVLNLRAIPEVPSIFDPNLRHLRMPIIFLRHFAKDISKPISDNEKSYEYIPTQVMTEYFKLLFKLPSGEALNGLAFESSKRSSGTNYALFFEQAACADSSSEPGAEMVLKKATRQKMKPLPLTAVHAPASRTKSIRWSDDEVRQLEAILEGMA